MLETLSSNAITAKAKAIYGKRLTPNNYTELLRLNNVSDVCAYLKNNTNYSVYLKGINESAVHRGQLENLLTRSRIEKFFSLCHFDFSRNQGFYRYIISNAEVGIILGGIMSINSGSPQDIAATLPTFIQDYACFDFKSFSKIKNFDDLLTVLEHTPYKNVLKRFNAPNGEINFRDCELTLKTFYYKTLLDQIDHYFKGDVKKELTQIVKIEIELLNLTLIYRMKRYFKKESSEILMQLLPFYYKLNKVALTELTQPMSKAEFVKKMRLSTYNSKMNGVDVNYIEDYTKRLKYMISRKMMRFSTNTPISFYSFMTLTQIEIENIIIIIEGIRYKKPGTEIQKLLIM